MNTLDGLPEGFKVEERAIYQVLHEVFTEVFARDDIAVTADTTARDIEGWDSFRQVELIIAAQERFGFRARSKELDNLHCVGDLVALIQSKSLP